MLPPSSAFAHLDALDSLGLDNLSRRYQIDPDYFVFRSNYTRANDFYTYIHIYNIYTHMYITYIIYVLYKYDMILTIFSILSQHLEFVVDDGRRRACRHLVERDSLRQNAKIDGSTKVDELQGRRGPLQSSTSIIYNYYN